MRRIIMLVVVALVMAAMMLAMAMPAFADKGPFVGKPKGETGKQACLQQNNPINPQLDCGKP